MITAEQVADLREGDVVEVQHVDFPEVVTRGPLHRVADGTDSLGLGYMVIRLASGETLHNADRLSLTVISRAPRPLYVNHTRTEPVHGDIVRDVDGDAWQYKNRRWHLSGGSSATGVEDISDCSPLTLLWDGTAGEVLP